MKLTTNFTASDNGVTLEVTTRIITDGSFTKDEVYSMRKGLEKSVTQVLLNNVQYFNPGVRDIKIQ